MGPVALLALLLGPPIAGDASAAASAEEASVFVTEMAEDVVASLTDPAMTEEQRKVRFRDALRRYVAVETVARWVVGRAAWQRAESATRNSFVEVYASLMTETYANRFADYRGGRLTVSDVVLQDGDVAVVRTRLDRTSSNRSLRVDWRLRCGDGSIEVLDVVVEGLSMAQTQRDEFASFLRRHDHALAALVAELSGRVDQSRRKRRGS